MLYFVFIAGAVNVSYSIIIVACVKKKRVRGIYYGLLGISTFYDIQRATISMCLQSVFKS